MTAPWHRGSLAPPWHVAGAALLLLWWIAGLGQAPLFDVDEGAFAEASREMLVSGDWGHTTLQGVDRFDKPILIYWLQAASMAAFGTDAWAVRLPSAICGWLWCLVLARAASQEGGEASGWMAALLTAGAVGPVLIGRAATADALLNLLVTCACLTLWQALRDERVAAARWAALWAALAVLTKGPIGLLIPLAAALIWCASEHRPGPRVRLLRDPWTWLIFMAVSLPWYVYAWQRHGAAFVDGFFVHHNLERFGRELEGHGGHPLYTPVALVALLLPWSLLGLPMAQHLRADWRDTHVRFLFGWMGFVLVLFAVSATKLPHYALYAASPGVLLAARWLPRLHPAWAMVVAVPVAATAALAAGSVQLARRLSAVVPTLPHAGSVEWTSMTPPWPASLLGALCALALVIGWPGRAPTVSLARRVATLLVLHAVLWVWVLVPWWAWLLQGPIVELAQVARAQSLHGLVQSGVHQPSFAFYAGQEAPRRDPRAGETALLRCDTQTRHVPQGDELARRQGWCLVRQR